MSLLIFFLLSFCASLVLTYCVRNYTLSRNLLDIPNSRSSHQVPTPRGGGLAFVVLYICGLCFYEIKVGFSVHQFIAFLLPSILVALVGFVDDIKSLSSLFRLLSHLGASGFAVYYIGEIPASILGNHSIPVFILFLGSILYLTWVLNLFNFMDGIDGLAALEAIFVLTGISFIYYWNGQMMLAGWPLFLAILVGGFLVWNFPPAKIFMGDIGSGFLGLILGLFSLVAAQVNIHYFFAWLILLGLFIVDSSYTLLERILRGEAIWEAHRDHAYQKAALYYSSHRKVTLIALGINCIWLFPLAFFVAEESLSNWLGLTIAYLPLIVLTHRVKSVTLSSRLQSQDLEVIH